MEKFDTEKLDEALETALQMAARTEYERFQRAVSIANVRYWYHKSMGDEPGAVRTWDGTFNSELSDQ